MPINYFRRLKIRAKMIISFSFILGLFVVFSLFMLISNYNVSSKRELLEYSRKTIDLIRLIRLNDRNFYLTWDKKYSMDNIELIRKVRVNLNNIIKKDRSEAVVSRVKSINNLLSSYNDSFERVVVNYHHSGGTVMMGMGFLMR